jgi:hypothetical protein
MKHIFSIRKDDPLIRSKPNSLVHCATHSIIGTLTRKLPQIRIFYALTVLYIFLFLVFKAEGTKKEYINFRFIIWSRKYFAYLLNIDLYLR